MNIAFAFRRLAEHLRVAGLAGGGGLYILAVKQGGDDAALFGAILALSLWSIAVSAALFLDLIFGGKD